MSTYYRKSKSKTADFYGTWQLGKRIRAERINGSVIQ